MSIVYNIRWGIKLPSVVKNTRKDFSSQVSLSIPILFSLIMGIGFSPPSTHSTFSAA